MAVFTAFSDESGTGDNQGAYLVGGYVAVESLWGEFARAWQDRVLESPPRIRHLHMREIRRKKFQKENRITPEDAEAKVEEATTFLYEVASSAHPAKPAMHAVLSVITRSDLKDMVAWVEREGHKIQKGTFDLPDYLCFLAYVQTALEFTKKMFPDMDKIDFVASRNGKVTKHFATYLAGVKSRSLDPSLVGELIPGDPIDRNPLQMADVLCWHHRRYYEDNKVTDNLRRLTSMSTFTKDWNRSELESFTQEVIDLLNGA